MTQQQTGSSPAARRPRTPLARALGVVGELLITLGVLLALFVAYSLWWTDVLAGRQADQAAQRLRHTWTAPAAPDPAYQPGGGIGFLHVPAMGKDYSVLIKMGTDPDVLNEGVAGVYTQPYAAAMPWAPSGNFALAAHRDGHGAKFHDLDEVQKGAPIVVETRDSWFVYRVDAVLDQTTKDDTGIVAPVPEKAGYTQPGHYITLTTCTPVYTSRYRMAVWGSLVRVDPVDAKRTPPPELR
ncbi:class E sortase [Kitasatospora viridis]|uniref:LPXTG-site transpeptidase (Sortase) family protein n=1 Tax=Kitasatospora viridis TaxID=281105 RepID=A0A561UHF5_9ACTN|nr:class E sortase [Kitasatospora viridis]TWF98784.1 LPXTG-site transpeptidase (sortase) family protein [Kitasatospora viridis]